MVYFLIASSSGIDISNIGFVLLVFSINFFIGFPVVYFLTKYLIIKIFSELVVSNQTSRSLVFLWKPTNIF